MNDKERFEEKSKDISWEEFSRRMDKIFDEIQQLIKDTNGSKNNR